MSGRFTLDGSEELERSLARLCEQLSLTLGALFSRDKMEALVLAGGYGRGQGGVLKKPEGDKPYNDLEFYVFLRGSRLLSERKFGPWLRAIGEKMSSREGLHIEFKIDSLPHLRTSPVTMFSYDLVSAHKVVSGPPNVFKGCERHLEAEKIPVREATRLLFNRCTGLLMVRELLRGTESLTPEQRDFIGRNIAKARLALGDAVLTVFGRYHWSCLERKQRLLALTAAEAIPELSRIQRHHQAGVEFKLHPQATGKSREELESEHDEISGLAGQLWLWLESRRLNRPFGTPHDYALSETHKWTETPLWRNYLLNLRAFGAQAPWQPQACRYPRERLLNSLPLLLWNGEISREPVIQRHLQKQLASGASDWAGLVAAYKDIWQACG